MPPAESGKLTEVPVRGDELAAQQRAALAVNAELLRLYWQIGRDIIDRQTGLGWGSKIVARLAHDLRTVFPDLGGFSRANLMYMRAFAEAWTEEIGPRLPPWQTGLFEGPPWPVGIPAALRP